MERAVTPPQSRSKRRRLNPPTTSSTTSAECSICLYSWNVNGIAPFVQPSITSFFTAKKGNGGGGSGAKASLRDFLSCHNWPSVLFLQEVKISPDDKATLHAVERAVKRQSSETADAYDYEAHFCLPSDKYNATGFGRKVYGVCSIVRKDFLDSHVERIRTVDWDAEGRFLIIETKSTADMPKLALINVYAVNGTENPYKDPKTGIVTGTRHHRKLQVHKLLQAECRALEAKGFGVVIAGDLNIARAKVDGYPNLRTFPKQHSLNRADFEARFFSRLEPTDQSSAEPENAADAGLGMIDTFRRMHPDRKGYTYYPRTKNFGDSCDRVDLIMLSRKLEHNLTAAGMHATPKDRGPSDHVPLFARLEFASEPTR